MAGESVYIPGDLSEQQEWTLKGVASAEVMTSSERLWNLFVVLDAMKQAYTAEQRELAVPEFLDTEVAFYPWTQEVIEGAAGKAGRWLTDRERENDALTDEAEDGGWIPEDDDAVEEDDDGNGE